MAGLTLSAGVLVVIGLGTPAILGQAPRNAENEKRQQPPPKVSKVEKAPEKEEARRTESVTLSLKIAGLGAEGCDVEIKPATPACRFKPITRHIDPSGKPENIVIKDLEVRGADRNCSFAITVNEPGQRPRTILRGFRLSAPSKDKDTPTVNEPFDCWISSPSRLARLEGTTNRK